MGALSQCPSTPGMPYSNIPHSLTISCRSQTLKEPRRSDQASGPLWQWHKRLGRGGREPRGFKSQT